MGQETSSKKPKGLIIEKPTMLHFITTAQLQSSTGTGYIVRLFLNSTN